jgi:hypothetical protein
LGKRRSIQLSKTTAFAAAIGRAGAATHPIVEPIPFNINRLIGITCCGRSDKLEKKASST